jgi:hypothetical protein
MRSQSPNASERFGMGIDAPYWERDFMKYFNTSNVLNILTRKVRKVESVPAAVVEAVVDAVSPMFE